MTEQHERERKEFEAALVSLGKPDDEFNKYHLDEGELYSFWCKAARANSGWLPPNDADVVEVRKAEGMHDLAIIVGVRIIKTIESAGYQITKRGV